MLTPAVAFITDPEALEEHIQSTLLAKIIRKINPVLNSGSDPAFSAVIHDKLQVPNTIRKAWNDRDNRCDICATHLNQLKQEAIQMVLTLEQAAGSEHYDASPGSPPPLSNASTLVGSRHGGGLQQPRDWAFVPAPYATSNYTGLVNKHSSKPNSLGVSNGAEKKSGSPTHQAKVSLQMATSPSNGNILNSVAIQAHQYLDGTWSLSRTNGVTLYPYQSGVTVEICCPNIDPLEKSLLLERAFCENGAWFWQSGKSTQICVWILAHLLAE
ncbi:kinesin-like protein KIF26B [Ictidomys tridecemlineatus]|nr:kinesin-like protein KIF26B [Ictidomys tridecemlineatus]